MRINEYVRKFGLGVGIFTLCGLSYCLDVGCGRKEPDTTTQFFEYQTMHSADKTAGYLPPLSEQQAESVRITEKLLSDIWNCKEFTREQKLRGVESIRRSLDQTAALHLIRVFPVQDNTGRVVPFDTYMRAIVNQPELRNTRLGNDPVGTAFDILVGNYRMLDFVRDHLSLAPAIEQNYCNYGKYYSPYSSSNAGINTNDFGKVVKDNNRPGWYRDGNGNYIPESTVREQQKVYDDMINKGARKDPSGAWVITEDELKRQLEEERRKKNQKK